MDINSIQQDLHTPVATEGEPSAGRRVRMTTAQYAGTDVHHLLYLPMDWKPGDSYPVIVEYPGNGPYSNDLGDVSTGEVDGCNLGYGISGGQGVIWVSMPFIDSGNLQNQKMWWGDVNATIAYCRDVVDQVCRDYCGDPRNVFIAGFSRGSIACNFIGLHDDEIAALWRGFICHSHYDGIFEWNYPGSDRASAQERLSRLGSRPQFISNESSVDDTKAYLDNALPSGNFTYQAMSFPNHTNAWVLRDIPEREAVRDWFRGALD